MEFQDLQGEGVVEECQVLQGVGVGEELHPQGEGAGEEELEQAV